MMMMMVKNNHDSDDSGRGSRWPMALAIAAGVVVGGRGVVVGTIMYYQNLTESHGDRTVS